MKRELLQINYFSEPIKIKSTLGSIG